MYVQIVYLSYFEETKKLKLTEQKIRGIEIDKRIIVVFILGLFPPCPKHGDVRCCSRQGLEALYAGMLKAAISQQPARVQVQYTIAIHFLSLR